MCEVYRSTFDATFPLMEEAIRKADFIAIDTEFTGLSKSDEIKSSLFDTSDDRYRKLKTGISEFIPSQIGIAAFIKDTKDNKYVAHTFNIYLFPVSFGPIDVRFSCQASSFEFLCKHKFDFNKFAYEGVSFLNEHQERELKAYLESQSIVEGLERAVDEQAVQSYCSQVAEWIVKHLEGDTYILQKDKDSPSVDNYMMHAEIRSRFHNTWTTATEFGDIVVEIISPEKRKQHDLEQSETQQAEHDKLLNSLLGFTRIFRLLIQSKKPIVGHNMFMDLLLMYDKLYQPLPDDCKTFKSELHQLFPSVYDTKHITASIRKQFENTGLLDSTGLGSLFLSLDSNKGKFMVICSPEITHAEQFDRYRGLHVPHEAGYDAYQCGYVFLRLAHILTFQDVKSGDVEPCPFRMYLATLKMYKNCVNVIRATVNHVKLDGDDPVSLRPELLFVQARKSSPALNSYQLAKWFSACGSVDIRLQGRHGALVATGNHRCANDILKAFRKHELIYVTKYNPWRHSTTARRLMWAGTLVSGGVCLWILLSGKKNS